jgi:putative hydrolase of HD superfamily
MTRLTDNSRRENSAEHSWHVGIMAFILSEYSPEGLDLIRVVKMLLIHDVVEIDAGDTFLYDEKGHEDKAEREEQAAERIFGLLPVDQGQNLHDLWREYEERKTPEAKYAAALDRVQPLLHNYLTGGATWRKNGVTRSMVLKKNKHTAEGAPELWAYARTLIEESVEKGYLQPG